MEILLVEDNSGDVRLTQEALNESEVESNLSVVSDGAAALDFLARRGAYSDAPIPDLILLDLNLPKLSGQEVLERIKTHDEWKTIPVVVLTTSASDLDIKACYALHVNCYITKPLSFLAFLDVVKQIEDFWLTTVRLPRKSTAA